MADDECVVSVLERQAAENEAAIRALKNWMDSLIVGELHATVRTEIHNEHAAAIARAEQAGGA